MKERGRERKGKGEGESGGGGGGGGVCVCVCVFTHGLGCTRVCTCKYRRDNVPTVQYLTVLQQFLFQMTLLISKDDVHQVWHLITHTHTHSYTYTTKLLTIHCAHEVHAPLIFLKL